MFCLCVASSPANSEDWVFFGTTSKDKIKYWLDGDSVSKDSYVASFRTRSEWPQKQRHSKGYEYGVAVSYMRINCENNWYEVTKDAAFRDLDSTEPLGASGVLFGLLQIQKDIPKGSLLERLKPFVCGERSLASYKAQLGYVLSLEGNRLATRQGEWLSLGVTKDTGRRVYWSRDQATDQGDMKGVVLKAEEPRMIRNAFGVPYDVSVEEIQINCELRLFDRKRLVLLFGSPPKPVFEVTKFTQSRIFILGNSMLEPALKVICLKAPTVLPEPVREEEKKDAPIIMTEEPKAHPVAPRIEHKPSEAKSPLPKLKPERRPSYPNPF